MQFAVRFQDVVPGLQDVNRGKITGPLQGIVGKDHLILSAILLTWL